MSHAANLRKYRPPHSDLPAKRRKLSPSSTALQKANGRPDLTQPPLSAAKLSAIPTQDLKAREKIRQDQSKVNVLEAEPGRDLGTSSSSSSSSSTSSDPSSSDDDSTDSESGDDDASEDDEQEDAQSSGQSQLSPEDAAHPGEAAETQENHVQEHHTTSGTPDPDADEEPSFGDLLRARAPETITVEAAVAEPAAADSGLVGPPAKRNISVPSANSLGTVLTQALKTNDADLLESCLHTPNLESIRGTIERIHPAHATALLQRLAERLHRRPGRAGSLMVWVQWTVVAHGGYLASQPTAMKELRTLYQVVKQRASGLQPLLALKGKLDMLEAQMQLRRNMQARSKAARRDEDEEGIIYVEGQEEEEDLNNDKDGKDQADSARSGNQPGRHQRKGNHSSKPSFTMASDDESGGESMPNTLPNGVDGSDAADDDDGGEDEADHDSDEEDDDLIDDKAEDTDADSDALSGEIDYDDVDGAEDMASGSDEEEDDDEDEDRRPSKRRR